MGDRKAASLPVHSVVGTTSRVWIKRETATPPGSPFHETWWIEAATYAVQTTDRDIQRLLDSGDAHVLRAGGRPRPDGHHCVHTAWDCDHCHDDPPPGHTCPRCRRTAAEDTP